MIKKNYGLIFLFFLAASDTYSLSKQIQEEIFFTNRNQETEEENDFFLNENEITNDFYTLSEYKNQRDLELNKLDNFYKIHQEKKKEQSKSIYLKIKQILLKNRKSDQSLKFPPWKKYLATEYSSEDKDITIKLKNFFKKYKEKENPFSILKEAFPANEIEYIGQQYLFNLFYIEYCNEFLLIKGQDSLNPLLYSRKVNIDINKVKIFFKRLKEEQNFEFFLYYISLPKNYKDLYDKILPIIDTYNKLHRVCPFYIDNLNFIDNPKYIILTEEGGIDSSSEIHLKTMFLDFQRAAYFPKIYTIYKEMLFFMHRIQMIYEMDSKGADFTMKIIEKIIQNMKNPRNPSLERRLDYYLTRYKENNFLFNKPLFNDYIDRNHERFKKIILGIYKLEEENQEPQEDELQEQDQRREKVYNLFLNSIKQIWDLKNFLKDLK